MKSIMSVRGELSDTELGLTLPHEHLFTDLSCYWDKSDFLNDRLHFSQPVTPQNRSEVQQKPWSFKDNIVLNDLRCAITEASEFMTAGGKTIVDASPCLGMGRNPQGLMSVSESTGVNIIMSCGRYSEPSMSDQEKQIDIEELAVRFLQEFRDGVEESGIKPGLLKVGFVDKVDKPSEIHSLRAAGKTQHIVGCALSIHPHIWQPDSHLILDILAEEKCDLHKVILCHQDYLRNEQEYLDSLVKRGCYIEFDTFGSGQIKDRMWQLDENKKYENLVDQIKRGNTDHLLISGDMCMKIMLTCGGGFGLKNIPMNVLPALTTLDIDLDTINRITVENPKQVLCH